MSLPIPQHASILEILNPQHIIPLVAFATSVLWAMLEVLSLPKSRKQLDIPRGDWLTVALGAFPVLGVCATLLWLYFLSPQKYYSALIVPGLILCLIGIGLRTWSKLVLGRFYTFAIGLTENHRILADGPYRFIRHPLYLGTFLAVTGFLFLTQSWATLWLLTVPTIAVYGLRLVKEEAYLVKSLGADYQSYVHRTARLIPFVW